MTSGIKTIAILGGTGALGSALTKKWSNAGYKIVIGSRDPDKAERIAKEIELSIDEPYIEIVEVINNSSFIAKKAKTNEFRQAR